MAKTVVVGAGAILIALATALPLRKDGRAALIGLGLVCFSVAAVWAGIDLSCRPGYSKPGRIYFIYSIAALFAALGGGYFAWAVRYLRSGGAEDVKGPAKRLEALTFVLSCVKEPDGDDLLYARELIEKLNGMADEVSAAIWSIRSLKHYGEYLPVLQRIAEARRPEGNKIHQYMAVRDALVEARSQTVMARLGSWVRRHVTRP